MLLLTIEKKKAKANFLWGENQQKSFDSLKRHLVKAPILKFPNFNKEFCIETDASLAGLGAVLSQSQKNRSIVIGGLFHMPVGC